MNMRFSPILFLPCLFSVECVAADWEEIIPTIEMMYPIWQINGQIINESGGFELILAEPGVTSLTIPDAETVLNGASWTLLGMTANVTGNAQEEYLLGTSVEGPTHGQLFVFTGPSRESTSIACHKIVMMYLVDMTGDGLAEIVTYEDHHYGTSTTRRVFNIYQVRAPLVIARIFAHDVVVFNVQR